MDKFLNLAVSGAVSGAIYSLVACGLVLTYSATGVFNLAYGAVAFTAAFLYYELHIGLGWPVLPAAVVTVGIFCPLLGLALDRAIFRRMARAPETPRLVATVGLLVALPAMAKWTVEILTTVFGADLPLGENVFVAPGIGPSPKTTWQPFGQVQVDSNQLIVLAAAGLCAAGLWGLLRHTALGLRMRAAVDRPELAKLRGIPLGRTSGTAWVIGTTLAGLAGVVGAPVFNSLDPGTYLLIMFVATAAAVMGRLRSLPVAFAAGLAVGVLQNLVAGYASFATGITGFNSSVPFVVLLGGLLFLGSGRVRTTGTLSEERPPPDHLIGLPPWRRRLPWALATGLLLLYVFFVADEFWVGLTARGLALGLVFLSFVVVSGLGGMVTLAQAAFATSAALTAGLLVQRYDAPFLAAMAGGILVAAILGALVSLPALRLGGLSLALATLALGFLGDRVLFVWDWFGNGQQGWALRRPEWGWLDLRSDRAMAVAILVLIGGVTLVIRNLQLSSTGRAIAAVRSADVAAATSGVSVPAVKLVLFVLSAAIAGLGGVVLATFDQRAVGGAFPTQLGLIWLASVVLFGIRRPGGAVIAGLMASMFGPLLGTGVHWPGPVPTFLDWNGTTSSWPPLILFGLGAVQLAKEPNGLLVAMASARRRPRPRPAPSATPARAVRPPGPKSNGGGPAALALRGVSAGYKDVGVLHAVDLELGPGSITALLGANGAGKSTLCAVVAGLLPPSDGTILLAGDDVTALPADARARQGLMLAPESRGIFPSLSVDENLTVWLHDPEERERAFERFPRLWERRWQAAGSLSGGEQQMLALAPVLIRPPAVLVADEPTLGLAPSLVEAVMTVLSDLRDVGVSVLLVEERARHALEIADRVALFELGRVRWCKPRAQVAEADLSAAYLGAAR